MLKAKFGFRYPVPHDVKKIQVSIDRVTQDLDVTRILVGTRFNVETTQAVEFETSTSLLKDLPRDGLVLEFLMSEGAGSKLYDTSRVDPPNNGTIYGCTWQKLETGKRVLYFDGVDDYVIVPDSPELNPTDEITIIAWVYPETWGVYNHIIAKQGGAPNNSYLLEQDRSNPCLHGGVWDGSSWHLATSKNLEIKKWYMATVIFDGSEVKLFINHELHDSVPYSGTINPTPGVNVLIGKFYANKNYWHGFIGLVAIYSHALDESEIAEIYEDTRVYFGV